MAKKKGITKKDVADLLSKLNIGKALVIDDKINFDEHEAVLKILQGNLQLPEFDLTEELRGLRYDIDDLIDLTEKRETPPEVIHYLKTLPYYKDSFHDNVKLFRSVLEDLFESVEVKENVNSDFSFPNDTILFLDYQLDDSPIESEDYIKCIEKFTGTAKEPWCVVFISSNTDFINKDDPDRKYNMLRAIEKSKYFNELRKDHKDKNSLYDYINKNSLSNEEKILKEIYTTLQNFYGGKIFYNLISMMKGIMDSNINTVLNDFKLLNARSLNEVLARKVSKEGEAEAIFLLNWITRQLTKNTAKEGKDIKKINEQLSAISEWSHIFHEVHEDIVLRKMVASEMWDSEINNRYMPVDFGDVFEIKYSDKILKAILLTQTCTLAVRGDGKRAGKLAVLAIENPEKEDRPSGVSIYDWNGEKLIFDLDDTITYPIDILDLTSFNEDGRAAIFTDSGVQLPANATWNSGYTKMITALIKRLQGKLVNNGKVIEINRAWVPYSTTVDVNTSTDLFDFNIKRIARLDSQYTLNIHQLAQSWWGRIGLPVSVNFMDEFQKEKGEIFIHGSKFDADFYVKHQDGIKVEVAIDIAHLRSAILKLYEGDKHLSERFDHILHLNELTSFHYATGLELMTLVNVSNFANQVMQKYGVYLTLNKEEQACRLDVVLGRFKRIILAGDEIVDYVDKVRVNSKGKIECLLSKEALTGNGVLEEKVRNFMSSYNEKNYIVSDERDEILIVPNATDLLISIKTAGGSEAASGSEE
ncbi:hypothetical protein [Paenibacillus timonensis]|uniref:hypothetical protein n=1 Tax=Paenibacillus timonensis TaxID=225915 RepID=UPI0022E5DBEC|nr:hypothetical protein [Paenibacillus timonensis]